MEIFENQEIVDSFSDMFFFKTMDLKYKYCNQKLLDFTKLPKEEIIGKNDFEIFPKINAQECIKWDKKLISEKNKIEFEQTYILDNQETIYFNVTKKLIKDRLGKELGILAVAKDITELKRCSILKKRTNTLVEKLVQSKPKTDVIADVISFLEEQIVDVYACIYLVDDSKKYLQSYAQSNSMKMFFQNKSKIKIEKKNLLTSAYINKTRIIYNDLQSHEKWDKYSAFINGLNLSSCYLEPMFSSTNEVIGTIVLFYKFKGRPNCFDLELIKSFTSLLSLSIEKEKNDELLKHKESLLFHQSKLASMGEMIDNIAHHWRQPLSIISTAASGVKIQKEFEILNEKDLSSSMDKIIQKTKELSCTLDNFKCYIDDETRKKVIDLSTIVDKTLNLSTLSLNPNNIKIIKNIEDLTIVAWENKLIEVFVNIFNNVSDALQENRTDEGYLFIDIFQQGNDVVIQINDTAGGINEKVIHKIFEPYFTTKYKSMGRGLGLFNSINKLEEMGGSIIAKNRKIFYLEKEYVGAMFEISLPKIN